MTMPHLFSTSFTRLAGPLLLAALMSSSPALAQSLPAGCEMGELATVPLTFTDDLRPVMKASLNGSPFPPW